MKKFVGSYIYFPRQSRNCGWNGTHTERHPTEKEKKMTSEKYTRLVGLIESARTEDERTRYVVELRVLCGSDNALASELIHLRRTYEGVKEQYETALKVAEIVGFPIGVKVPTLSGTHTAQLNTTKNVLDTDTLAQMCEADAKTALSVAVAVQAKKDKISIHSLTMSDVKGVVARPPTVPKREVKFFIREA